MTNDLDESIRIFCEATRQSTDIPIARPATFHGRWGSSESGSVMLHPTTMHGTRPEIAITYSPENKARQEAECIAGLSYWGKLRYRIYEFLRRQSC